MSLSIPQSRLGVDFVVPWTRAFANNNTAGNGLFVYIFMGSLAGQSISVSSLGDGINTYLPVVPLTMVGSDSSGDIYYGAYYAKNIVGGTKATITISIDNPANVVDGTFSMFEIGGVSATDDPVFTTNIQAVPATGGNTPLSAGPLAVAFSSSLMLAISAGDYNGGFVNNDDPPWSQYFTFLQTGFYNGEQQTVSAPGSYPYSIFAFNTDPTDNIGITSIFAFPGSAGGSGLVGWINRHRRFVNKR